MREQRESKVVWVLAFVGMFVFFSLVCFNEGLNECGDMVFLHNRAVQMRDCLLNGHYPFFYYEDLGGIGYGTPIFYGQLTLLPFLPFVDDISSFLRLYFLACLVLNFFAFRSFLKRISNYATLSACFYIFGLPFSGLFMGNLPANVMAVGWSWLFFAFCIDYFRDGKSFPLLILSYFMIWQSNFNSMVLATVVCFGIFLVYFKRERLRDYAKLFVCVAFTIGYNIVNILYHWENVVSMPAEYMLPVFGESGDIRALSIHPLGGFILRNTLDLDICCGFMTIPMFLLFLFFLVRGIREQSRRFKVFASIIGVVTVVSYVIGVFPVWEQVYKATDAFFQFPIRYFVLIMGFVVAILSRVIRPNIACYIVIGLCIVDLFITDPFRSGLTTNIYYVGLQLGNGEYASEKFIKDWDIYNQYGFTVNAESGGEYSFEKEFNLITVDCSVNQGDDVLTLPKMYYKGYQARGEDGEVFEVRSGYSNYCEVAIEDYTGSLTLQYKVPVVIMVLFIMQVCLVGYWSVWSLMDYRRVLKRRKEVQSVEGSEGE